MSRTVSQTSTRRQVAAALGGLPLLGAATAWAAAAPSLGAIRAVTITAAELKPVEDAWTRYMGHRVVRRGRVPAATARSWGAPALAGAPFLILGPESGEPTFIRFVRQAPLPGYDPAHTYGWGTTEITVQDSDALYERLKDSPFKPDGPPRQVPTYSYLKAMQATGPAGERLNLTWITETRPDLAVAKSFVGRCFIAVAGGPDLAAAVAFYQQRFGNAASPIRELPQLKLAVITLNDGSKIELDELPAGAKPRARPPGGLAPGLALVTFECASLDRQRDRFIAPPVRNALEPRRGARTAVIAGPAGELIELVSI